MVPSDRKPLQAIRLDLATTATAIGMAVSTAVKGRLVAGVLRWQGSEAGAFA